MTSPVNRRPPSQVEPSSPVNGYLAQLRLLATMSPVNFELVITCAENLVEDRLKEVAVNFFKRRPAEFWEGHMKEKERIWKLLGLDLSSS